MDPKYGFIVDNYITQNPNDKNELLTLTKRLNNILGSDDYVWVADQGYWKIKHIEELYGTNTIVIIPDRGAATRQKISNALKNKLELNHDEITESTFKKYNFIFLPEEDVYICPFGMLLTRQDKYHKTNRKTKLYACNNCHECPYKEFMCQRQGQARIP